MSMTTTMGCPGSRSIAVRWRGAPTSRPSARFRFTPLRVTGPIPAVLLAIQDASGNTVIPAT